MNTLKTLREYISKRANNIQVKTNGDFCNTTGKKVYALFSSGERLSPYFTVEEWNAYKINNYLFLDD